MFEGVLDNLGRATAFMRWIAIPNGDENVAMVHYIPAYLRVGILS